MRDGGRIAAGGQSGGEPRRCRGSGRRDGCGDPWQVARGHTYEEGVRARGGSRPPPVGADVEMTSPGSPLMMTMKSGGNDSSGMVHTNCEPEAFVGDNVDDELAGRGYTGNLLFFTSHADLGDPIARDRAWFYGFYNHFRIDRPDGGAGWRGGNVCHTYWTGSAPALRPRRHGSVEDGRPFASAPGPGRRGAGGPDGSAGSPFGSGAPALDAWNVCSTEHPVRLSRDRPGLRSRRAGNRGRVQVDPGRISVRDSDGRRVARRGGGREGPREPGRPLHRRAGRGPRPPAPERDPRADRGPGGVPHVRGLRSGIQVRAAASTPVAVGLDPDVGGIDEPVTVDGAAPVIDPRRQRTDTHITVDELQEIPSARDPWVLLQTVPGVVVDRVNVGGRSPVSSRSTWRRERAPPRTRGRSTAWSSPTWHCSPRRRTGTSTSSRIVRINTGGADVRNQAAGAAVDIVLQERDVRLAEPRPSGQ